MFFGKLFKKDHRHYQTQGAKYLAAERYADARVEFLEALKCCPSEATGDEAEIRAGLTTAGNRLGELNLQEGERSVTAGDLAKASDHFVLAVELAFDETIKAMARDALRKMRSSAPPAPKAAGHGHHHGGGGCGGCGGGHHGDAEIAKPDFSKEEVFSILAHTLPPDLASRYAAMGDEFAKAYLLIHDGNDAEAFPILQEIAVSDENDIVIYELALIMYRAGKIHECEALLNKSLKINQTNSMSYLALVHLMSEGGRLREAIATVERMMELEVMVDQGQIMLGDLHQGAGDSEAAFEAWTKAISFPSVAKAAAERLVPILEAQGRSQEAKYLAKTHLKGCC